MQVSAASHRIRPQFALRDDFASLRTSAPHVTRAKLGQRAAAWSRVRLCGSRSAPDARLMKFHPRDLVRGSRRSEAVRVPNRCRPEHSLRSTHAPGDES
eukprot:2332196-Pleurochrysis_carterae.AAC.2